VKDDPKKAMQKSIRRAGPWGLGGAGRSSWSFGGPKRADNLRLGHSCYKAGKGGEGGSPVCVERLDFDE